MSKVVLVRHGQSEWNHENRFTGWTDVDLTEQGRAEARGAGAVMNREGLRFDHLFTSFLRRAVHTLWIIQDVMDLVQLPVSTDWRLNERHYGALQGLNKDEVGREFGAEQLQQWRRGYLERPPALAEGDERRPELDPRYEKVPLDQLPGTESLEDTLVRSLACWRERIQPKVTAGEDVLIVAHNNSLRALIKFFDDLDDHQVVALDLPTGLPLLYEFDDAGRPRSQRYLEPGEERQRA